MKLKQDWYIKQKEKKYYTCKKCGSFNESGWPYWTFGRCFNCQRDREKQNRLNRKEKETCKTCGKAFPKYNKNLLYCSKACVSEKLRETRNGKNNPAYRNGLYPARKKIKDLSYKQRDFLKVSKQIKSELLDAQGFLFCELCKTSNSLKWEVHHIVFRSECPKHPNLHDRKNLILLCIKCHNKLHKRKGDRAELVEQRGLRELFFDRG